MNIKRVFNEYWLCANWSCLALNRDKWQTFGFRERRAISLIYSQMGFCPSDLFVVRAGCGCGQIHNEMIQRKLRPRLIEDKLSLNVYLTSAPLVVWQDFLLQWSHVGNISDYIYRSRSKMPNILKLSRWNEPNIQLGFPAV